jgi:hypothetical protein
VVWWGLNILMRLLSLCGAIHRRTACRALWWITNIVDCFFFEEIPFGKWLHFRAVVEDSFASRSRSHSFQLYQYFRHPAPPWPKCCRITQLFAYYNVNPKAYLNGLNNLMDERYHSTCRLISCYVFLGALSIPVLALHAQLVKTHRDANISLF